MIDLETLAKNAEANLPPGQLYTVLALIGIAERLPCPSK